MESRKAYIIAVSGGVDSVVLLHKLATIKPPQIKYVVAHFDHGIREDSGQDRDFVRKLADTHKFEFVSKSVELGEKASENEARDARYQFLRKAMKDNEAEAIIVAHHQDDVLETMVVNMLRGTSPRGLIGFTQPNILRPLINRTKQELLDYAKDNELDWREDSSNMDTSYLRNYVRINIMPKLEGSRTQLLDIRERVIEAYREIDDQIKKLLVQTLHKGRIARQRFVSLPYAVQCELVATMLRMEGLVIDRKMTKKAVMAIKTLPPGKHIELSKTTKLYSEKSGIRLGV